MEENNIIGVVEILDKNSKDIYTQDVDKLNLQNTKDTFVQWATILSKNTFRFKSCVYMHSIEFTIYRRTYKEKIQTIVICITTLEDIVFEQSYILPSSIDIINIENISDIISFIMKVSSNDIMYCKNESIINLIKFQMERIISSSTY